MKKNGFKKTAAGIMSVAMMLSAVVLPGTIKNAPAISNVLTASAGNVDIGGGVSTGIIAGGAKLYIAVNPGNNVVFRVSGGDGGDADYAFSVAEFLSKNPANSVKVILEKGANISPNTFKGVEKIDSLIIEPGVTLHDGSLAGTSISELTLDYSEYNNGDAHTILTGATFGTISNPTESLADTNLIEFKGTVDQYNAFKAAGSETGSGNETNLKSILKQLEDAGIDGGVQIILPSTATSTDGLTITMVVKVGQAVGATFYIENKTDKKALFTFGSDDENVSSTHHNVNSTYIIGPNGEREVTYLMSPKNMASPVRYTINTKNDDEKYWGTVKQGYVSVEDYMYYIVESDEKECAPYKQFAKSCLRFGDAAQKYFVDHGAKITGLSFNQEKLNALDYTPTPSAPKTKKSTETWTETDWAKNVGEFDFSNIPNFQSYSVILESMPMFRIKDKDGKEIFRSGLIHATGIGDIYNSLSDKPGSDPSTTIDFNYSILMWANDALGRYAGKVDTLTKNLAATLKDFGWEANTLWVNGLAQEYSE